MRKIVSIIVPYVQEFPQIAFTLRAIHTEMRGIPHEIIAVDNMCPTALLQQWGLGRGTVKEFMALPQAQRDGLYADRIRAGAVRPLDKGHDRPLGKGIIHPPKLEDWYGERPTETDRSHFASWARKHDWLQYVHYDEKLSHWNAKNAGVAVAQGRLLYFVDGHVMPGDGSMRRAVELYEEWTAEHGPGSFHSPLTYHIMEDHRLIYKFVYNADTRFLGYSFTGYPREWDNTPEPQEVPCMSLCGMLTSRELYDKIGGFPKELGIYGGGENYWNFTLSVIGAKKWVVPGNPIHHYGNSRHYHWVDGDFKRNQAIAAYCYGGLEWLSAFCRNHNKYERCKDFFERLIVEIPQVCGEHRKNIENHQVKEVYKWIEENS